jgi:hypothetical protein
MKPAPDPRTIVSTTTMDERATDHHGKCLEMDEGPAPQRPARPWFAASGLGELATGFAREAPGKADRERRKGTSW